MALKNEGKLRTDREPEVCLHLDLEELVAPVPGGSLGWKFSMPLSRPQPGDTEREVTVL